MIRKLFFGGLTSLILSSIIASHALAGGGVEYLLGSYDNPADYMFTKNNQFTLGGHLLDIDNEYSGNVTYLTPFGAITSPDFNANSHTNIWTMNFRYVRRVHEQILVGMSFFEPGFVPVGFSGSPAGIFNANEQLRSKDFSPSITFQPTKWFAVGAGADIVYSTAKLTFYPVQVPRLDTIPLEANATNWSYGFHLGATLTPQEGTILSLVYYSKINRNFKGPVTLPIPGNPAQAVANAYVDFPSQFVFRATQFFSKDWFVNLALTYSYWTNFNQIVLNTNLPVPGTIIIPLDYTSQIAATLFTRYKINEKYGVQGYVAWDPTPTNNTDRGFLLPEGDRVALGIGGVLYLKDGYELDITGGYAFNVKRASVNSIPGLSEPSGNVAFNAWTLTIQFNIND